MTRRLLLATAALCALVALGQTARADTVVITSGTVSGQASGFDNAFMLNFAGQNFSLQGSGEGYLFSHSNILLAPGTTHTSTATLFPSFLGPGQATYNGITYPQVRISGGSLVFSPVTYTAPPAGTVNVTSTTAPFSMTGTLDVVDANTGTPLFSVDVVGSGIATINFRSFGDSSLVVSVVYNFADPSAVPEPATLVLLGAGLGGLALKRRRRRARA